MGTRTWTFNDMTALQEWLNGGDAPSSWRGPDQDTSDEGEPTAPEAEMPDLVPVCSGWGTRPPNGCVVHPLPPRGERVSVLGDGRCVGNARNTALVQVLHDVDADGTFLFQVLHDVDASEDNPVVLYCYYDQL